MPGLTWPTHSDRPNVAATAMSHIQLNCINTGDGTESRCTTNVDGTNFRTFGYTANIPKMYETKDEHLDRLAESSLNGMLGRTSLSRTSTLRKAMLSIVVICMCTTRVMGQRHQHPRIWPPANIEPCLIQCPVQHVQMTGNRTAGTEISQWGSQPMLEFISNSQLQTSVSPSQPTLAANAAAKSSITTLVTSVTSVKGTTKSQETSFPRIAASVVAVSGGERTLLCDTIFQVVITLSCMSIAIFHET